MKLMLQGITASAVGVGIANSMHAVQDQPTTAEAWVNFCIGAAEEAYAEVIRNPPQQKPQVLNSVEGFYRRHYPDELATLTEAEPATGAALEHTASEAARCAFRCCMPHPVGRKLTQAYIACIVAGLQHGYLPGKDASQLLFAAQVALSASPKRRPNAARKAKS